MPCAAGAAARAAAAVAAVSGAIPAVTPRATAARLTASRHDTGGATGPPLAGPGRESSGLGWQGGKHQGVGGVRKAKAATQHLGLCFNSLIKNCSYANQKAPAVVS